MPTQKTFKGRVRTRMTKTGESYTTARQQLLRKGREPDTGSTGAGSAPAAETAVDDLSQALTSDGAMERATGQRHATWFARLDDWGAADHTHTEIARWLHETQGVPGWWSQNITVSYERARGMRAAHERPDGFSVNVSKTIAAEPERALAAFTDVGLRKAWLGDVPLTQRPTRAANSARFDWADPASILIVYLTPKGPGKTTITVTLERLPDAEAVERLKASWRAWLGALKVMLEAT